MRLVKRNNTDQRTALIRSVVIMIGAILGAFVVGSFLIMAKGVNPVQAYIVLFQGAFGSTYRICETLLRMTPLLIISVGVAIGYRTGMFNMGGEGQFIFGMIGVMIVFLWVPAGIFTLPLAMLSGMLFGGICAGFPGAMKAKYGVSESIINIMLNYIMLYWLSRLLNSVLKDPNGYMPQTALINEKYFFPLLVPNTRLHVGFLIAILVAVTAYIVLFYTTIGFQMRAIGSNIHAARYAGFPVVRLQFLSMFVAGALVGLAGFVEIGGVHHRLMEGISANYGWDAIPIALIGRQNPLAIILSSLLFAAIKVGSNAMQTQLGVPNNIASVLQGLVILFVIGSSILSRYRLEFGSKGKKKKEVKVNA